MTAGLLCLVKIYKEILLTSRKILPINKLYNIIYVLFEFFSLHKLFQTVFKLRWENRLHICPMNPQKTDKLILHSKVG